MSFVALVSLLAAAGAWAYFTSSGSGTGSATVGSASSFTVTPQTATGGPLYPGSGSESIAYTVTNTASGHQNLSATSAAIAASGGNVTQNGTAVTGCASASFTATNTAPTPLPQNLAGGGTSTGGSVTVTMQDSGANQDACQGVHPDVTISAS